MAKDIVGGDVGGKGSMQGQIKTPMAAENVCNKGGGATHSYKNTMNLDSAGGKGGMKTDGSIKGPGEKGKWKK
jgi:hypothetical protein